MSKSNPPIPMFVEYDQRIEKFRDVWSGMVMNQIFHNNWMPRYKEFPIYQGQTDVLPPSLQIAPPETPDINVWPVKHTFDIWMVRDLASGENKTIGEMKAHYDDDTIRTTSYDIFTGGEISASTYNKLWKFSITRTNEAILAAEQKVIARDHELREKQATIEGLDATVKLLEKKSFRSELFESGRKLFEERQAHNETKKQLAALTEINLQQAERIRVGTAQNTELKIEVRAKANLEKRVKELTDDLLRTADERDNGLMEAVRAKLPEELAKATKKLADEKALIAEERKLSDITSKREIRKLEKKVHKLKGALRATANDAELIAELQDANMQLTERVASLEAGQNFLAATSIEEEERLSGLEAVGLHSSYDNFPTINITIHGGVVNFASSLINQ